MTNYCSEIINGIDETRRSESAYFHRVYSTSLTRESTLKSSKNSLEVEIPAQNIQHDNEQEDSDSGNNEDSGFTSIKVLRKVFFYLMKPGQFSGKLWPPKYVQQSSDSGRHFASRRSWAGREWHASWLQWWRVFQSEPVQEPFLVILWSVLRQNKLQLVNPHQGNSFKCSM